MSARNLDCQHKTAVNGKSFSVPLGTSCHEISNLTDKRKPLGK